MKTIIRLSYFLSISLIIFSCSKPAKEEDAVETKTALSESVQLTEEQMKTINVQLGKIEKKKVSSPVRVNGMLDVPPQNLVTITAPMGGFVRHTELLQGMSVKQGQVVAVLEHPDYIQLQQDYLDTKTQLEFLELEYKRQQDLSSENVNATKVLQQAKSNYFSAKAKVDGLRARLKMINVSPEKIEKDGITSTISITTPIAGFVTEVNVNRGAYVNSADVMFEIVDTEHLHAEAQVFEKDIMKLKVGQTMRLTLANETEERFATVYLIGKEISPERTVRVHCHLTKEDVTLIPGLYFNATIETGDTMANTLPEEAIVSYDGKMYVFVQKEKNTFHLTPIEGARISAGLAELSLPGDFDLNSTIVTNGTYTLISLLKNVEEE